MPNRKVLIQLDAARLALDLGARDAAEKFIDSAQSSLSDIKNEELRGERRRDVDFLWDRLRGGAGRRH